jgi:hypothetical protein
LICGKIEGYAKYLESEGEESEDSSIADYIQRQSDQDLEDVLEEYMGWWGFRVKFEYIC